jgi:nucleoid DNA-binding protein
MTKRDLIDEVVKLFPRFSRRDAEVIVKEVFESLTQALVRGGRHESHALRELRRKAAAGQGVEPEYRRAGAGAPARRS